MVTKDGVTVYRALGFDDPAAQAIMEASRDASVRTASEAGDGTTTATILSEAIVRRIKAYCEAHPSISPQRVVRRLEKAFRDVIEPTIKDLAIKADLTTPEGRKLLLLGCVGFLIVWACYGTIAWAIARVHGEWCKDQYKITRTHADTVSTARLCGAP